MSRNRLILQWVLTLLLLALLTLGFTRTLDAQAERPLEQSFQRALITFGVVRGINAIVSVVQGTEVAIEPAGVGVILTPGEIFDPVNDLIERFSWIVLAASTSLGAQRILVSIGSSLFMQALLAVSALFMIATLWNPGFIPRYWRAFAMRLCTLIVILRFLVPLVVLANEAVYAAFLSDRYQTSHAMLEQAGQEVEALQAAENAALADDADDGILDTISRWYDRTTRRFNVEQRLQEYEARLANASENIIDLIVVFILQTLVFPLIFLWLSLKLARLLLNGKFWWGPGPG